MLKIKNHKKKISRVIDRNLNPVWNQTLIFHASLDDIVTVSCFDKDLVGKDDALGKFQFPLNTLVYGKPVDQWFDLQLVESGDIRMIITALDFGLPPDTSVQPIVPCEIVGAPSKLGAFLGRNDSGNIRKEKNKEREKEREKETNILTSKNILKSIVLGDVFIDFSGHMEKLPTKTIVGISHQSWQRRWVVLQKHKLIYYRSTSDVPNNILGSVTLKNATVSFEDNAELVFMVNTKAKLLTFRVSSQEEFEHWYTAISTNINVVKK